MSEWKPDVPSDGDQIGIASGELQVPDRPIIPYIEGDGTGPDLWAAASRVFEASVNKAYGDQRQIVWMEVLAGEKAFKQTDTWLPDATVDAFREYLVGIKGPLTTPVGGGIRSLNVALRQILDLYVCLRPVRHFPGVPSPVKQPELVDMVIFRENTEDIYAGIEFQDGEADTATFKELLKENFAARFEKIPLSGIGRFRYQTGIPGRHEPTRQGGHRLRHSASPGECHPRPQGQHHEVHRRRLSRLGIRSGTRRLRW